MKLSRGHETCLQMMTQSLPHNSLDESHVNLFIAIEAFRLFGNRFLAYCVAGVLAMVGLCVVSTSPALAIGGEPQWQQPPIAEIIHSTRAVIMLGVETEEIATEWYVEYAPAEAGKAPPAKSSVWKITDSGLASPGSGTNTIYLLNARSEEHTSELQSR